MKIKTKHNKKRNTAFLYEALVRQMTKCVLEEQFKEKEEVLSLIKKYFSKGSALHEELKIYKAVLDCERVKPELIERVLSESKSRYDKLDKKKVFSEQSKLIGTINRNFGKGFYNSFVPNYKNIATVSAIFNNSVSIKNKVLLERKLVDELSEVQETKEEHEMLGTNLVMGSFIEKFNNKYGHLHEEQKVLLNTFILSLSDGGLSMQAFLNEELDRLKVIVEGSKNSPEIAADPTMGEGTNKVIALFEDFKKKPVDAEILEQVLKIQNLAREIQS